MYFNKYPGINKIERDGNNFYEQVHFSFARAGYAIEPNISQTHQQQINRYHTQYRYALLYKIFALAEYTEEWPRKNIYKQANENA